MILSAQARNILLEPITCDQAPVPVCWAKCAATTRFLFARAHRDMAAGVADSEALTDGPFDLGYMRYNPELYEQDLFEKRLRIVDELSACGVKLPLVPETFESPRKNFRSRCRLAVHVDKHPSVDNGIKGRLTYLMWDAAGIPTYPVRQFPIVSVLINELLHPLRLQLESSQVLLFGLCAAHFLSTQTGEALVVLLYDSEKELSDQALLWRDAAKIAIRELLQPDVVPGLRALSLIATSKGVRLVEPEGRTYVEEALNVRCPSYSLHTDTNVSCVEERKLFYHQPFDGFSNPNIAVNEKCLGWLCSVAAELQPTDDLLELYCGAANHTCALAKYFSRVLAVELNKSLCKAAEANLALNGIQNASIMAMRSESFARTIMKKGGVFEDRRRTPPTIYHFGTVLVDPPRGGLDADTRQLLRGFDRIIYISCCPASLVRDLKAICFDETQALEVDRCGSGDARAGEGNQQSGSHTRYAVRRFAVFDHFAYSQEHLESAVLLVRT